ncbi:hypothetical protein E2C01_046449 [Portunus trituberculatus]|uniref:Uncharacterized protein n=1 Tax=Portunus trituberculatus TaxID=210409 RepID=A0A5B7G4X4_PORTR|nr:hypothetical protein [Portunus trituberculatus]
MGVGSGWAGPLMLLLLLLACRASPTITSARRPRLLNLSRVARPPTSPAGLPVPLARGQMQYTLDLLASPASREGTDEHEDARLASQLTVEAQLLPWAVGVGAGGGMGCLEASVATRAAHLALQHHPPPAGVALLVLPPPPGECSFPDRDIFPSETGCCWCCCCCGTPAFARGALVAWGAAHSPPRPARPIQHRPRLRARCRMETGKPRARSNLFSFNKVSSSVAPHPQCVTIVAQPAPTFPQQLDHRHTRNTYFLPSPECTPDLPAGWIWRKKKYEYCHKSFGYGRVFPSRWSVVREMLVYVA